MAPIAIISSVLTVDHCLGKPVRTSDWEILQVQFQGALGRDWHGTPSSFPSRPCGSSPGPPAAIKNAFADAQSSNSPQFLSGPNGSNPMAAVAPASADAVATGGVEVARGGVGSSGVVVEERRSVPA